MHIPSLVPICAAGLPYQRELERLSNRAETTGCDRCGFRFAVALPYLICRTAEGGFSVRCPVCAARVVAIAVQEIGEDPRVAADRQWFVAHPKRRWRLREAFPGDIAASSPELDVDAVRDLVPWLAEYRSRAGLW